VLGAGGVLGGAWLVGALHAIATESGWDPGSADHIVGTSAGAMIGALLACGVPPWFMVAHSAGEQFDGLTDARGEAAAAADRSAGGRFRLERRGVVLGPGSWRLAAASLARPYRYSPMAVISGWLPRGFISTEPLKDTVRRACAEYWAPHPNYWVMALDSTTGRRVAFGRAGSPAAELPDAHALRARCLALAQFELARLADAAPRMIIAGPKKAVERCRWLV
jgi:NTE family protein